MTVVAGFDARNHLSSWVGHELRVVAREAGWLCKMTGIESLFGHRKGALQAICSSDAAAHWGLRCYPDLALRSPGLTGIIEVKAMDRPDTLNASVELVQLCALGSWDRMGIPIHYAFGRPTADGRLEAWILPLKALRPCQVYLTPRSEQFEINGLERFAARLFPEATIVHGGWTRGSNTPYALVSKAQIIRDGVELKAWLHANFGSGQFGMKQREGWEGRKEAHRVWAHVRYQDWRPEERTDSAA